MTRDIGLGDNLYTYCKNNPINNIDPNGFQSIAEYMRQGEQSGAAFGPWGMAIGLGLGLLAGIAVVLFAQSTSKARTTTVVATTEKNRKKDIPIYRFGSSTYTNLTQRPKDVNGLSFSTIPPSSGSFCMTTINIVNTTKVLTAIPDGPTHVSVKPVNIAFMQSWIASRPNAESNPHPLTLILKSIVK